MKNTQSKIKPMKIGKQSGRTYCFGHKDYAKKRQATRSKNDK